ncbi:hypothetical protein CR513_36468, partial [Mucuna pruriens]
MSVEGTRKPQLAQRHPEEQKEAKHPRKTVEDRRGRRSKKRGAEEEHTTQGCHYNQRDMRYDPPRYDEPMMISMVVAEYKVERVLIDQGSSANILYWSTYMKMGLKSIDMEPCVGKLHGFTGEQVEIRGAVEFETTFGEGNHARAISMLYMTVDVEASDNIIMGQLALNKLGAMVSTYHLCMKYPVGKEVGRVWADHRVVRCCYEDNLRIGSRPANKLDMNVLDLDLDPRCGDEHKRPLLAEDLKEINIGPNLTHKMKIGTTLVQVDESFLAGELRRVRMVPSQYARD